MQSFLTQTGPEELLPIECKKLEMLSVSNPTNNINTFSKFSVDISA
jgi:hypothetical protein